MKIGILGPSGGEVGKLIESLEERRDKVRGQVRLYEGRLEGLPVVIGVSGVCKVNAAICAETLLLEGAECLLVCGVAGGIDPRLRIGDTVICREIAYHDVDISFLCVDEAQRGQRIGKSLYDHAVAFARESGCYNVTLNVWAGNDSAFKFYQAQGLRPQKYGMETIL